MLTDMRVRDLAVIADVSLHLEPGPNVLTGETGAGKSILISGAGGSIGSELCRQLLACKPRRMVLFEISELALYTIEMELRGKARKTEIIPVLGSVLDAGLVARTFGPANPLRGHLRFTARTTRQDERLLAVLGEWLDGRTA